MTIRLIASDLDGTLYRDDKTISERTKNTLAEVANRKICFVPVTGRSILGVDRLIRELPWIRYVITGNGARIYDLASNTVIHEELLPAAQVIKMQELSLTLPVACACYIGDQGYISRYDYDRLDAYLPDKNLLKDVRRLHEPVEDLAETLREKQQGVLKFQVYFSDANLRKPVTDAFLNVFPDVSAASTLEYNVEITSKNADSIKKWINLDGSVADLNKGEGHYKIKKERKCKWYLYYIKLMRTFSLMNSAAQLQLNPLNKTIRSSIIFSKMTLMTLICFLMTEP